MQVKKPTSSELTRLMTKAPSDCCLCLGNRIRKLLSLCLGHDGTPDTELKLSSAHNFVVILSEGLAADQFSNPSTSVGIRLWESLLLEWGFGIRG